MPTPHPTVPDLLFQHAIRLAKTFCSHEGLACASVPFAPFAHDAQPIRSQPFQEWLLRTFQTEHEVFPSRYARRCVIDMLAALATNPETPRGSIDLRLSFTGSPYNPDSILLDLANSRGDVIAITAGGWNIDAPPHPLRRSRAARPLPEPAPAVDTTARSRLALPGFTLHPACLAWLLAALRPAGPYPILVLQGPSTSGKTTLARMLRALLDPATSPVCRTPRHQRDLLRLAWNNYVLVFDHATRLPAAIVDSLCRLSSGAGFAFDEMADGSDVLIRLQRPVILTLPEGEHLGHLRSRAFLVPLAAIPPHARRSEAELFTEFAAALPALLSRLCTAVSSALATASATTLESKPAFIDAATWSVAAAPSLGISPKEMETALTPDEFTRDLAAFIQETGGWEGTATALLAVLQSRAIAGLPANANALARKIHHSPLASYNVECSPHRTRAGDRAFRLTVARQIVVKTARSA